MFSAYPCYACPLWRYQLCIELGATNSAVMPVYIPFRYIKSKAIVHNPVCAVIGELSASRISCHDKHDYNYMVVFLD